MVARARSLLVWLVLVGCGQAPVSTTEAEVRASPQPLKAKLEVGYSALRISLPLLVAQARGLYAAHGLDVTLKRYDTAQPLVEEILDGRVLAGGYAALPIVLAAAAKSETKPKLVGALMEDAEHPVSYLLRKRGDTTLQQVSDLRGKRIGVLPTLAYKKWLSAMLAHAGLAQSDVTVIALAPPAQVTGLAEGVVDALFTNDPMATTAVASSIAEPFGPPAPLSAVLGKPVWFGSLLLHPELIAKRAADVAALVAAHDDAVRFIESDQAAARRLLSPFLREAERPHIERYPNARFLRSDEVTAAQLAAELQSQAALGAIEPAGDAAAWLYTGAARP
jgi:ABC-type nitrate/sulfonate/bicarbonate transport system substrate-binding protein